MIKAKVVNQKQFNNKYETRKGLCENCYTEVTHTRCGYDEECMNCGALLDWTKENEHDGE